MIPIISFIGKSNCGKTTFIEKLIPDLIGMGYRIATVKHDRRHGFEFDKEGKDSWRHKNAGAEISILSSPEKLIVIKDVFTETSLQEIAFRYAGDSDLLIAEGYKDGDHEKIEINNDLKEDDLICKRDKNVIAVISDRSYILDIPGFKRDSVSEVAKWIEKKFLLEQEENSLSLYVNSQKISLKPFIRTMLTRAIKGMVSSLKGCEGSEQIEIKVFEKNTDKK